MSVTRILLEKEKWQEGCECVILRTNVAQIYRYLRAVKRHADVFKPTCSHDHTLCQTWCHQIMRLNRSENKYTVRHLGDFKKYPSQSEADKRGRLNARNGRRRWQIVSGT